MKSGSSFEPILNGPIFPQFTTTVPKGGYVLTRPLLIDWSLGFQLDELSWRTATEKHQSDYCGAQSQRAWLR
jgi:hypothetical protein